MAITLATTKSLFIKMICDNKEVASGSAFTVKSRSGKLYLVTNRHNVTGRNNLTNELMPPCAPPDKLKIAIPLNKIDENRKPILINNKFQWKFVFLELYDQNGTKNWIEHPILGSSADFVAIELDIPIDTFLIPYECNSTSISLPPTSMVSIVGFPFGENSGGFFPIWTSGFIASEIELNYNNMPQFLVDARTRPGQSGSPVIHYINGLINYKDGSSAIVQNATFFLGIYSGRINAQSDIGIIWKASAIQQLIDVLS